MPPESVDTIMVDNFAGPTPGACGVTNGSAAQKSCSGPERRRSRRTTVPLQVRMRPASSSDGAFEEIGTTANATTTAFYFHTTHSHYSKGMQLRINFPFSRDAFLPDLERRGEVIRVDQRPDGYGVAVCLLPIEKSQSDPELILSATPIPPEGAITERRLFQRTPFIAPVNLTDQRSNARMQARCSDLSLCGCFVDTLNPLPVATVVTVEITKGDKTLEVQAIVCSQIDRMGMGLFFSDLTASQLAILESWLAPSGSEPELVPHETAPAAKKPSEQSGAFEDVLIRILNRKGVLTPSEAADLRKLLKA